MKLFKPTTERTSLMPDCNDELFVFPSFDRRKIEASFQGDEVSSDGGVMLLREADRRLGLTRALDVALPDPRDPDLITHEQVDLLRQRILVFPRKSGRGERSDLFSWFRVGLRFWK